MNSRRVKVVISMLDEFGEERTKVIRCFNTIEKAEAFIKDHEQDFADNPEIYAVYIED